MGLVIVVVCTPVSGLVVCLGHLRLVLFFMSHVGTSQGKGIARTHDGRGINIIWNSNAPTHEGVSVVALTAGAKATAHPAGED